MLGPAHSASGPAAFVAAATLTTFTAAAVSTGGTPSLILLVVGMVVAAGFALVPDFDTRGTAVISLGIVGTALMYVFRGMSSVALLVRGRGDDPNMDTHRTFTHTLVFAAFVYFSLTAALATPWRNGIALVVLSLSAVIGMNGVVSKFAHKLRDGNPLGVYGVMAGTLAAVFLLWKFGIGDDANYANSVIAVIPVAAAVGVIAHLAGDIITKKGIPLLWPIPIRGKCWFSIRPLGSMLSASNPLANNIIYWGSIFITFAGTLALMTS